nr:MAG TPA: hypothetical protein [Caudoviricetes sp.]
MGRNKTDKTESCPCPSSGTLPGSVPVSNRGRTDRQNLVLTEGQTIYPLKGVKGSVLPKGQEKRSEAGSSAARRTPFFLHLTKSLSLSKKQEPKPRKLI